MVNKSKSYYINLFYKEIEKRMDKLEIFKDSNCVGTVQYLVGEIEEDRYICPRTNKILKMKIIDKPILGCVVEWYFLEDQIAHTGIVSKIKPLLINHRDGYSKPFYKNQIIFEILEEQNHYKRRFRIPPKLEKLIKNLT